MHHCCWRSIHARTAPVMVKARVERHDAPRTRRQAPTGDGRGVRVERLRSDVCERPGARARGRGRITYRRTRRGGGGRRRRWRPREGRDRIDDGVILTEAGWDASVIGRR